MSDVFVRYLDMPTATKGFTVLDEDGNYNMYINPRLSNDVQREVYEHEMTHIKRGDFHCNTDIREKETVTTPPAIVASVKKSVQSSIRAVEETEKKVAKPCLDEAEQKRRRDRRVKQFMNARRAKSRELKLAMEFPGRARLLEERRLRELYKDDPQQYIKALIRLSGT